METRILPRDYLHILWDFHDVTAEPFGFRAIFPLSVYSLIYSFINN